MTAEAIGAPGRATAVSGMTILRDYVARSAAGLELPHTRCQRRTAVARGSMRHRLRTAAHRSAGTCHPDLDRAIGPGTQREAILWHGGEAMTAREAFRITSRRDRDALISFLQTL